MFYCVKNKLDYHLHLPIHDCWLIVLKQRVRNLHLISLNIYKTQYATHFAWPTACTSADICMYHVYGSYYTHLSNWLCQQSDLDASSIQDISLTCMWQDYCDDISIAQCIHWKVIAYLLVILMLLLYQR